MRRALLIVCGLLAFGMARAQEPAPAEVPDERPFDSTFSWAPLWVAVPPFLDEGVPVVEIAGEIAIAERHSGQLVFGIGWRQFEDIGTVLRLHIGGGYRFYMVGTTVQGLYAGIELMREELSQATIERVTTVGALAGFKLVVWKGLTVDLAAGAGTRFQPGAGSTLTPIVNLSIGFSTRIRSQD